MIKAVIVDFDDTLCLTEEACFYLENEALKQIGRPPFDRDIHKKTWGMPTFQAIELRSPGTDVATFTQKLEEIHTQWVMDKKVDDIPLHNLEALDALIASGKMVFVLTGRTDPEVKHLIAPDHGLASRLSGFYHHDTVEFRKPDPRVFQELLRDHRLVPHECVYVGDSITDAQATKAAGLHFIACLEAGIRTREDFAKEGVDRFITRFADLPAAVSSLE